jgi:hypothetical protein
MSKQFTLGYEEMLILGGKGRTMKTLGLEG